MGCCKPLNRSLTKRLPFGDISQYKDHSLCKDHGKKIDILDSKVDKISEDIAIVKSYLIGNGREGLIKKVDRHDRYFYMITGAAALVSCAFAVVKVF